jgi:anti-sigma regulatory factor (Ser/Thr protein kinase)
LSEIEHSESPHELRLDLPAAHSAGRMARQMLKPFASGRGVPENEIATLEFVIGELLDNAVDHGGGGAAMDEKDLTRDVRISLHVEIEDETWIARIGDQGGGDPADMQELIAPADGLPDLENERGRGFFLIVGMVDELRVEKSVDGLGLQFVVSHRYAT